MTVGKESARGALMLTHGLAMVVLGFGLLYIRGAMTTWFFHVLGCVFAVLLVAASLLFIAISDWICIIGSGSGQTSNLRGLLIVSLLAAGTSLFLILYPGVTIRTVCYLTAVYSLLLSIGKFHLAVRWRGTGPEKAVVFVLAGIALLFSGLLVAIAVMAEEDRDVLTVIAAYSFYMGLQSLLTTYYLRRHAPAAV